MIESPRMVSSGNALEDIQTMRSYLFRIAEQINMALESVDREIVINQTTAEYKDKDNLANLNNVKALIIKTGERVEALNDYYTAIESDFGSYKQTVESRLDETESSVTQYYNTVVEIDTDLDGVNDYIATSKNFIRSGLLYWDANGTIPVYGIAIGNQLESIEGVDEGGETVELLKRTNQYAVYTAEELAFYDAETKVAAAGKDAFYMNNAECGGYFKQNDWKQETTGNTWTLSWEG